MKITKSDEYILKNWGNQYNGYTLKYKRFAPEHDCYEFIVVDPDLDYESLIGIPKGLLDYHLIKVYNSHVIETVSKEYNV